MRKLQLIGERKAIAAVLSAFGGPAYAAERAPSEEERISRKTMKKPAAKWPAVGPAYKKRDRHIADNVLAQGGRDRRSRVPFGAPAVARVSICSRVVRRVRPERIPRRA